MATTSTNTTVANTSNATFQAWVAEVLTALVTTLGLTQTADTGQINPATVALPGAANTSAGYAILEFNDTLNATSPAFLKLEFGTGNTVTAPMMWITPGTGSNGSGTLTGTVGTRVACCLGNAPNSTSTNYTSRYCYNTTQGFLGVSFKQAAGTGGNVNFSIGGFFVYRSVNNAGAPTATSLNVIGSSTTASGSSNGASLQTINYSLSSATAPSIASNKFGDIPFNATTTIEGTAGQVFPIYQYAATSSTPGYGITNALANAILAEVAINATVTVTILGSLSLTYIAVGWPPGNSSMFPQTQAISTSGMLMLWQ